MNCGDVAGCNVTEEIEQLISFFAFSSRINSFRLCMIQRWEIECDNTDNKIRVIRSHGKERKSRTFALILLQKDLNPLDIC